MALISDAPRAEFRLSQLIYDTRYRSMTIQVVFLLLFLALMAWVVDNTIQNFANLGKNLSYKYLGTRAGYDINQMLVQYTNDSTHGRALLVGLLNTLFLGVISCILATIIGVTVGILRLSKNWIVSRLMTVYVEAFRNVPVVLWIVLVNAIFSVSAPEPKAFRGENPSASMILFDSVAVTNRGVYVPEPLFSRSLGNIDVGIFLISVDLLAILAAIFLSIWAYRLIGRHATVEQNATGLRPITWWKSVLVLTVPVLAVLSATGFHLGYPELKGFNFVGGTQARTSLIAMWLALSIYSATYIAENVRAGIMAISRGQSEAAFALGLRPGQTTNLVILPQAMRVIVPPMISQYLSIMKNTSLGIAVGYMDLKSTLGGITMNQTGRELESMLLLMGIYLIISLAISSVMNIYNASVKLKER